MSIEIKHRVKDELGIHARPAGELVKQLSAASSDVILECNHKEGNAKSIMSIMSLAVKQGDVVTFKINGADEEEIANQLKSFLQENF
ncbi:MAG: HPr family phosphocarrier protein [Bifidobacteriaceae bacterium]|jgi:phosphocarrier protein|nr:HPr family phosphocarrier protein [Bifidobacteriaceae bacterium]